MRQPLRESLAASMTLLLPLLLLVSTIPVSDLPTFILVRYNIPDSVQNHHEARYCQTSLAQKVWLHFCQIIYGAVVFLPPSKAAVLFELTCFSMSVRTIRFAHTISFLLSLTYSCCIYTHLLLSIPVSLYNVPMQGWYMVAKKLHCARAIKRKIIYIYKYYRV